MTWLLAYLVLGVLFAELGLWSNRRHGRTDYGVVAYLFGMALWLPILWGSAVAALVIILVHGRRLW